MFTPDDDRTSTTLLAKVRDLDNATAWQRFLSQYRPLIVGWCCGQGIRGDDAEEVASMVQEKLARKLPEFQYDAALSFRAWLKTVVSRAIIDYRRRRSAPGAIGSGDTAQHERLHEVALDQPAETDGLSEVLSDQLQRDLLALREACDRIRQRVSANTWQAFWLTAVEDQSGPYVAAQLGMKVANVYVHKNRVLKLLRAELGLLVRWPSKAVGTMPTALEGALEGHRTTNRDAHPRTGETGRGEHEEKP